MTVHVQDSRSGASLSGTSVSGIGSDGTTDRQGNITFSNIWANSYYISASSTNYNSGGGTFAITGNQTITIALAPIDRLTIRTIRTGVDDFGRGWKQPESMFFRLVGPVTYSGTTDSNDSNDRVGR